MERPLAAQGCKTFPTGYALSMLCDSIRREPSRSANFRQIGPARSRAKKKNLDRQRVCNRGGPPHSLTIIDPYGNMIPSQALKSSPYLLWGSVKIDANPQHGLSQGYSGFGCIGSVVLWTLRLLGMCSTCQRRRKRHVASPQSASPAIVASLSWYSKAARDATRRPIDDNVACTSQPGRELSNDPGACCFRSRLLGISVQRIDGDVETDRKQYKQRTMVLRKHFTE